MDKMLNIEFEKAVRFLSTYLPISDDQTRKPILFHSIRVGVYLYNNAYTRDIILSGVLHDVLEFTAITAQMLRDEFGDTVTRLVLANTKDDAITNAQAKTNELIKRCIQNGQDALIVKTADILDSFNYYTATKNKEQIQYCLSNAKAIFEFIPAEFNNNIFDELKQWRDKIEP